MTGFITAGSEIVAADLNEASSHKGNIAAHKRSQLSDGIQEQNISQGLAGPSLAP
jgi:hypothetical protein